MNNNYAISARIKLDSEFQLNSEWSKLVLTKFNITFLPEE